MWKNINEGETLHSVKKTVKRIKMYRTYAPEV